MTVPAPRWDLSNVYPSLESNEFKNAIEDYKKQVAALENFTSSGCQAIIVAPIDPASTQGPLDAAKAALILPQP